MSLSAVEASRFWADAASMGLTGRHARLVVGTIRLTEVDTTVTGGRELSLHFIPRLPVRAPRLPVQSASLPSPCEGLRRGLGSLRGRCHRFAYGTDDGHPEHCLDWPVCSGWRRDYQGRWYVVDACARHSV